MSCKHTNFSHIAYNEIGWWATCAECRTTLLLEEFPPEAAPLLETFEISVEGDGPQFVDSYVTSATCCGVELGAEELDSITIRNPTWLYSKILEQLY